MYCMNLILIVHFIIWLCHYVLLLTQFIDNPILHFLTYSPVHNIIYINDNWEVKERYTTIHYISYLRWDVKELYDVTVILNLFIFWCQFQIGLHTKGILKTILVTWGRKSIKGVTKVQGGLLDLRRLIKTDCSYNFEITLRKAWSSALKDHSFQDLFFFSKPISNFKRGFGNKLLLWLKEFCLKLLINDVISTLIWWQ